MARVTEDSDIYNASAEDDLRRRIEAQQEPTEPAGGAQSPVDPAPFVPPDPPPIQAQGQYGPTDPDARSNTPPQYNLPAPGTPIYGQGGVFTEPGGTVQSPYYNPPAGGGGAPAGGDVVSQIRNYQASHPNVDIAAISTALGLPRYMYGSTPSNNELVVNGQKFKVIGADGTPNQYWYTGGDDSPPPGVGGTAATGGGGARAPISYPTFGSNSLSQYGSTPPGQPQGIWGADYLAQLRQLLMARLQEAGKPVDENASGITEALTGARNEATRASDKERTDLAERLYAQGGLNTDAISQQVQQSGEKNATALGTLRGKLIMQEFQAKREDLRSLLALALQSGDAESARAIQAQMAELEATLRREGYGVQLAAIQANQNQAAGSLGL